MALAYDQQTVQARASGVDSLTQTTGQAVDAGDLLVVCTSISNATGGAITVTDDATQTYTLAISSSATDAAGGRVRVHYFPNSVAATVKVTVNPPGASADIDFTLSEVSGAATASPLDAQVRSAGTSNAPNVVSGTLAQANEIIFAVMTHDGATAALTPDATYTQIGENENNSTGQCYNAQYKIVAATTSDTADWSKATSVNWETVLASFKEAAAGETPERTKLGVGTKLYRPSLPHLIGAGVLAGVLGNPRMTRRALLGLEGRGPRDP